MSDVNAVVETPDKKMKEGDHFSPDGKWEPQFVSRFYSGAIGRVDAPSQRLFQGVRKQMLFAGINRSGSANRVSSSASSMRVTG